MNIELLKYIHIYWNKNCFDYFLLIGTNSFLHCFWPENGSRNLFTRRPLLEVDDSQNVQPTVKFTIIRAIILAMALTPLDATASDADAAAFAFVPVCSINGSLAIGKFLADSGGMVGRKVYAHIWAFNCNLMAGHLLSSGDDNNKRTTTTARGRAHLIVHGLENFSLFRLM